MTGRQWGQRDGRERVATRSRGAEPHRAPAAPDAPAADRRTGGEPLSASWDPARDPRNPAVRRQRRPAEPGLRRFVRTYGWRVYALPVLLALTVLAVLNTGRLPLPQDVVPGAFPQPSAQPAAETSPEPPPPTPLVPNPDASKFAEAKVSAELPAGGAFTESGAGTWAIVPGNGPQLGTGELFTYTVELENGIALPGGPEGLAQVVDATLANPKSWIGSGKYSFQRVDAGAPDIRVTLASQQTARQLCGFRIPFDASCWRGGRAVLSTARWERGAVAFEGNVVAYQQYVVNHEVGHALGFGHKACGEQGALAPIMMQQTWGLSNDYLTALGTDNVTADGKSCAPNPWPYPTPG